MGLEPIRPYIQRYQDGREFLVNKDGTFKEITKKENVVAKFRKKPVVVEAEQWFKHGDNENVEGYCKDNSLRELEPCKHCDDILLNHGWIKTLEGGHIVCPGDWIITGVHGEKYPCKPDIFEKTYEKVG